MKRLFFILSVVLTLGMLTLESSANVTNETQISLRRHPPIGGATKPSKAPVPTYAPIVLTYDELNNKLNFYDENNDIVSFCVYNNVDDSVLHEICDFDENHSYSTSLDLNAGSYTIIVQINGIEYFGTFDIEE